jgi:hypothetical protein
MSALTKEAGENEITSRYSRVLAHMTHEKINYLVVTRLGHLIPLDANAIKRGDQVFTFENKTGINFIQSFVEPERGTLETRPSTPAPAPI